MNTVIRILFRRAMALTALRPAARALQWTSGEVVLRPQADGTVPAAVYAFRNDTVAPGTITQVGSSCDCATADLAQKRMRAAGAVPAGAGLTFYARVK